MKESNKQWSLPEIIGGIILVIIFLWLIRSPHPPVLPEAPSDLIARVISSSSIEFSWTDNSDNETGFQVYRKRGEDFVLMATTSANNGFYTDIGFFFPATYYYRIRAVNKEGDSDWSNTASVTISEGEPKDEIGRAHV